eukprot:GHUV01041008.1.p2 GENE.GHUV01041008.1~~GHUV01041008.1.p2  ORF type:complete len:105 (+),score=13.37 GHUV01041008.1:1327-1641(+)
MAVLEEARGCVLVIDEAYGLHSTNRAKDPYKVCIGLGCIVTGQQRQLVTLQLARLQRCMCTSLSHELGSIEHFAPWGTCGHTVGCPTSPSGLTITRLTNMASSG